MSWLTFLPAALTLALGIALGVAPLPLHPSWSARLLTTVAATTCVATIGTLVFITVNYAATLFPRAAARLPEWALFGDDRPVPAFLGLPALTLNGATMLIAGWLMLRWTAEVRQARRVSRSVLDSDTPLALAVPGRNGGVLVSRGLLRVLGPKQLQVVFHHEASHLRHHHHRYLALGSLAAATIPLLRPLNTRLRFALERWADEDAAEAVGDRTLVAHTIARVALAQHTSPPAAPLFAGFAESGVVQRVQALLDTAPDKNTLAGPVALTSAGLSTGTLASIAWQIDQALGFTFL